MQAEQLTDDDTGRAIRSQRPLRAGRTSSRASTAPPPCDGRSGGLVRPRRQAAVRAAARTCDVVLVGAGTVRAEGYGALRVSDASARWRRDRGLPPHPVFAIVSGRLDLDVASPIFTEAPVRPSSSPPPPVIERSRDPSSPFRDVADVMTAGAATVDVPAMLAQLHDRGLTRILCEGGPTLFGSSSPPTPWMSSTSPSPRTSRAVTPGGSPRARPPTARCASAASCAPATN